jgi:phenylpropionate dioxygenase-like ring-hydroxylating dioxygenase large terminal subunit
MQLQPELIHWTELREQLARVLPDPDRSHGIPPACYADTEFLKQEIIAIFHRGWVSLGRSDRWLNAGDYSAMEIGDIPVIVVHNKAGELKAFANCCRHRCSRIMSGDGNSNKFKCPFHWWTYDLDGKLQVYPRMEKAVDFNPDEFRLVEFPVASQDGFSFISFESDPPSLIEWLGDFESIHKPWGLGQWVSTRVREFEVDCNWKAFIEVFNEYYHLPMVHPDSINWLYTEPDMVDETAGQFTTQFGATEGAAALMADTQDQAFPAAKNLSRRVRSGTRYTWVYPNLTFAVSQDSLWMYQAFPLSADRCRVLQTICFPAETVALNNFENRVIHYYDRIDTALNEDLPFLAQQQAGFRSKFAKQGRFAALEPSVGKFAYWYSQRMLDSLIND